jgi:hypothetical protein
MAVINITITASATQTIPGIPDTIAISTSEPSTVFFTLDGSSPTLNSPIYIVPIVMPQTLLTVVLNVFATNGVDNSAVITQTYSTTPSQLPPFAVGARVSHSATTNLNNASSTNSLYPFGTDGPNPNFQYTGTQNAGITVFNESQPATPTGFDANGNPAGFINNPSSPNIQFKQIYSTENSEGEVYPGVGNLPSTTRIIGKSTPLEYVQEQSSTSDKLFNPRALVIYQNATTEDPTNPVIINRGSFSLENTEIVRDGVLLMNTALDSPPTQGSFVRREYNPRTNEFTAYYRDNTVNRWIISTFPYQPTKQDVGALYQMVFPRDPGVGMVFKWVWNQRVVLH